MWMKSQIDLDNAIIILSKFFFRRSEDYPESPCFKFSYSKCSQNWIFSTFKKGMIILTFRRYKSIYWIEFSTWFKNYWWTNCRHDECTIYINDSHILNSTIQKWMWIHLEVSKKLTRSLIWADYSAFPILQWECQFRFRFLKVAFSD
jgi:hypothetical protein